MAARPGRDFTDELCLTDKQIELIQRWAATGAREGETAGAPHPPTFTPGWRLGPPDLIVESPRPLRFRRTAPTSSGILSSRREFTKPATYGPWRSGPAIPGPYTTPIYWSIGDGQARQQEATPGAGFPGMDLVIETETFDPDSHFLFWKPGSAPYIEPEDGMAPEPGNDLVFNVHFRPTGKTEQVRPSIGLYFTDQPQTKFPMLLESSTIARSISLRRRDYWFPTNSGCRSMWM